MALSVEDNILRCFSKFGAKVTDQTARAHVRWRNAAPGRPSEEAAGTEQRPRATAPYPRRLRGGF
jgi:hypothetical protein